MPNRLSAAWEKVSLRSKLTALSVALIGVLLLVSSAGTIALLRTYLQQNLDNLLTATASALRNERPETLEQQLALGRIQLPKLPSDYVIAYLNPTGSLTLGLISSTNNSDDFPDLREFTLDQVIATGGLPFDVENPLSESNQPLRPSWRMIAVPLPEDTGSLVVALPTDSNRELLNQYRAIGAGFGVLLLVLSALSIWLTITGALRPLREVERISAAVGKGDTSQRLIERPGNTEIARINRSLNGMLNSIEGALSSRTQTLAQMRRFVADASHELRTPLVSVRGYAELYRMGALKRSKDVAEAMARIESEAIRMTGLVESLLALTRLDEGATLKTADTDLNSLIREVAQDATVANDGHEISITDLAGHPLSNTQRVMAQVDANQIRQVATNLLANAIRFSPSDTGIQVKIGYPSDNRVRISVVDHGEGIPTELRDKVFERFYRVDNSRNQETGGSGLGLAIVKSIVERHAGTIVVSETPGGGASFTVDLPTVHNTTDGALSTGQSKRG